MEKEQRFCGVLDWGGGYIPMICCVCDVFDVGPFTLFFPIPAGKVSFAWWDIISMYHCFLC